MNKTKCLTGSITFALGGLLLAGMTGCLGVVGPGYVDVYAPAPVVYVPAPEVVVFGGFHRGGYDRDAGRRGHESRDHDRR